MDILVDRCPLILVGCCECLNTINSPQEAAMVVVNQSGLGNHWVHLAGNANF